LQFSEVQKPRDLDLGLGRGHTGALIWSRSTHTPNEIEIGKTSCTDRWTHTSEFSKAISSSLGDEMS